jgi:hypothetical protein
LAYALVELRRHSEALQILDENIAWLKENNQLRLLGNCYALRAEVHLQAGDLAAARAAVELAHQASDSGRSNDQFLITRIDLLLKGFETRTPEPFLELKARAAQNHDWEAMREADLYRLKIDFQMPEYLHLVFGSSKRGFRARIQAELGAHAVPNSYVLGDASAPRFDIVRGEIDGKPVSKRGTKCHQLVEILLRDFYQHLRVASLFSELFPGEHFDVVHSTDRVHQLILRTRQWLKDEQIPLAIVEKNGFYSLKITGNLSFLIPVERRPVEHMNLHFEKLRLAYSDEKLFSSGDIRKNLSMSKSHTLRLITWALASGKIEKVVAEKRHTKYKIAKAA